MGQVGILSPVEACQKALAKQPPEFQAGTRERGAKARKLTGEKQGETRRVIEKSAESRERTPLLRIEYFRRLHGKAARK